MSWLIPFLASLFAIGGLGANTARLVNIAHEEYPPLGEFVQVDGYRTHLIDRGEGDPVVMLHGIGGSARVWQHGVLDTLTAHYRVIAPDRPGHGLSERPEGMTGDPREQAAFLAETLDQIGVTEPVFLIGQSWGATVAAAFALLYPDRTRGIVFLSPYLAPEHRMFSPSYDLAKPRALSDLVLWTVSVPLSQHGRKIFAERMFYPDPIPDYWFGDTILLSQTPKGLRTSAADMRVVAAAMEEMAPRYGDIAVPVTVVLGLNDQIVSPLPALRMAADLDWELLALGHTGHAVQIVETDAVVDAIFRTLDRAGASPAVSR